MKKILLTIAFILILCSNTFASYLLLSPDNRVVISGFNGNIYQLSDIAKQDAVTYLTSGPYKCFVEQTNECYVIGVPSYNYSSSNPVVVDPLYNYRGKNPIISNSPSKKYIPRKTERIDIDVNTNSKGVIYSPGYLQSQGVISQE